MSESRVGATPGRKDEGRAASSWRQSLGRRALTAVVLIPIVIALVFFGGWVAFAGTLVALLISFSELRAMFLHRGWHPLIVLGAAFGVAALVGARVLVLAPHALGTVLVIAGAAVSALLVLVFGWLILTRRSLDGIVVDWALTLAGAFYLGWPMACFLLLRGDALGAANVGFWWLLALFFMTWANDTFALLSGHYFGRGGIHPLSPVISPKKTWEGFIGGLVFTVIAAFVFLLVLPGAFHQPIPHLGPVDAAIIGVLVAIAATIGDLAESLLKRGTGVKDSGTIVPGHGGLLDRMDSLLFVVFVVFFYAAYLHALPF
ncbi:MAG TPA: phosphatidate cytidylyltransferase [Ktedonobacterales bacterium]|nr:phosphatidate cytidylyltransferase [Ktedonobacterales bacterium]